MLGFSWHSPLKLLREKRVQGFLTIDGKRGESVSEAYSNDFIPEKKEFAHVLWHFAVNVIERHLWTSQWICFS
jgi:hypothetical protein